MNYMVELFNVYGIKTFMVDSIVEAYEYFFSAKDSKKYLRGHIVDVTYGEVFAEFGYND